MSGALPTRPLLKPWYRLARGEGKLALEYGQRVVCLEGRAVDRLLPALLPLLDGTRTLPEVSEYLGEPLAPAVDNALRVLGEHGLLTEGPPPDAGDPRPFAAAAASAAARGLPPDAARAVLAEASAGIAGAGPVAEEIARALRLQGVGRVQRVAWDASAATDTLTVVAPGPGELPELATWNEGALERGLAWLQVLPYDGRFAAVGPLYLPPETGCYECFRLRRASNVGYPLEFAALDAVPLAAATEPALASLIASLATLVATRRLTHADVSLAGAFYAVEPDDLFSLTLHHVYRVPRCPVCSPTARHSSPIPWGDG